MCQLRWTLISIKYLEHWGYPRHLAFICKTLYLSVGPQHLVLFYPVWRRCSERLSKPCCYRRNQRWAPTRFSDESHPSVPHCPLLTLLEAQLEQPVLLRCWPDNCGLLQRASSVGGSHLFYTWRCLVQTVFRASPHPDSKRYQRQSLEMTKSNSKAQRWEDTCSRSHSPSLPRLEQVYSQINLSLGAFAI